LPRRRLASARFTPARAACPATNVAAAADAIALTAAGARRFFAAADRCACNAPGLRFFGLVIVPARLPLTFRWLATRAAFAAFAVRVTAAFCARIDAAGFPAAAAPASFCLLLRALDRAARDPPELNRPRLSRAYFRERAILITGGLLPRFPAACLHHTTGNAAVLMPGNCRFSDGDGLRMCSSSTFDALSNGQPLPLAKALATSS
jgi:hypothetical protein